MSFEELLPRPREIERRSGVFKINGLPPGESRLAPPAHPEGYVLEITPAGIAIAGDRWNAMQTLELLRQGRAEIPCGIIRDWPSIRRRGMHIDLKGYQPKFTRLLEMVRLLARYKINTILLEIEDKLTLCSAPDVGIPGAYTADQMRELSRLCHELHIELIPKLQCLGHVDYLLKHPRYAHLRENGHPYQFCPQHPGTFDLWQAMAAEIMGCFPGHCYFHVGGDETSHLGECDRCRPLGKARVYAEHVERCLDFVASAGRRPIMWDDILRNLHGHLSESELGDTWRLGRKAILMYWAYGYGGRANEFPFLARYHEAGLDVWGASGCSGAGSHWFENVPALAERATNIDAWTTAAVAGGIEGVVCTAWTRVISYHPPDEIPEAGWFNMLYAAESMWSGRTRDPLEHCAAAARSLFGMDLPGYGEFLMTLDHAKMPRKLDCDPPRNAERLRLLNAAIALVDHEYQRQRAPWNIYELLHAHHGLLGRAATDYAMKRFRDQLAAFVRSLEHRSADLRAGLEVFYEASTVDEMIRSRFGRDPQLVAEVQSLLDRTPLV